MCKTEMATELIINNQKIGSKHKPFFIAEAGLNHNGDINIAKQMIDKAIESGADAIKFQTYKSEEFLAESSQYFDFFKNVELSFDEFKELSEYAKEKNFTFFSAPFDIQSADFLNQIDVSCFKIASSDLTNLPLIRHIAKMKKPMIISTGIATMKEVDEAINWCLLEGNDQIALLHCVANYPTLPEETNLNSIQSMIKKFSYPVGYSDNGESTLVDLAAVSMGACIIEKHYTLDKTFDGPDHSFSIEPNNLKQLTSQLTLISKMKGTGLKMPTDSEVSSRNALRKSITARVDIQEGEKLSPENLSVKRPEGGIEPKFWDEVVDKQTKKFIKKDTVIKWNDIA
jgi:N,N'-diacetyllegionaminate synthase